MCNATCDNKLTECVIARRLGKHPDDNANRSLLITVDNESTKRGLFSRLYRLKDVERYSSINASNNMREETERMVMME